MLNEVQNAFPVIIPAVHPMRNVLKGFKDVHNFEKLWKYFNRATIHIIQIGAGGTGGYTAVDLMRFIGNLPKPIQKGIYYTIIDGDDFEPKNLGRQLCQDDDIGKNKAETLVENYAEMLGCLPGHVVALPEYVKSVAQLTKLSFGVPRVTNINNTNIHDKNRLDGEEDSFDYGNTNLVGIDCNTKGYPTFTDAKVHSRILVNFPDAYDYNNMEEYEDSNGFPSWTSITGDNNYGCSLVPIFIDCVDNNSVRNIINSTIDILANTAPSVRDHLSTLILNKEDSIYRRRYSEGIHEAARNGRLNKLKIYSTIIGEMVITDENNKVLKESLCDRPYNSSFFERADYIVPSVYLVASGNGKYNGQVSWGRYSFAPFEEYLNTIPIMRYEDLWGNNEHPGSFASKDKYLLTKTDNLDISVLAGNDKEDIRYMYEGIYVMKGDLEEDSEPEPPSFKSDGGLNISKEKFLGVTIGNFVTNNVNDVSKDACFNLMSIMYNLNCILDGKRGNEIPKTLYDTGSMLRPYFSSWYISSVSEKENVLNELNDANIDAKYFDPIALNSGDIVRYSFNSVTGKVNSFVDQYHNFTDWVSQYISVPLPYQLNPSLLDVREDEREEHMSCAERAEQNIQFINANKTASNLVIQYVTNIINGLLALETPDGEEFRMNVISTEFDTYTGIMQNKQITSDLLRTNPIKCSDTSLNINRGMDPREAWHLAHNSIEDVVKEV